MGAAALGLNKGVDDAFSIPGTESQEGLEQLERTFARRAGPWAQRAGVAADGASGEHAACRGPLGRPADGLADLDQMPPATSRRGDTVGGLVTEDGSAAIVQLQLDGQSTT